jgi:hypothetical protein
MAEERRQARRFRDIAGSSRITGTRNMPGLEEEQSTLDLGSVRATIAYAIKNDYKVDMFYADDEGGKVVLRGYRSVSPVAIGTHVTSGNIVFRAYLMQGVSKTKSMPKWRLFRADRVRSIKVYFSPTRAKWNTLFRPGDKHIGNMFTEVYRNPKSVARRRARKQQNNP